MSMVRHLSVLALRKAVQGALLSLATPVGERSVETVVTFLSRHFTEHQLTLTQAMQRSHEQAWKALEIALAGESLWSKIRDTADHKAFRQQIRAFLDRTPLDNMPTHGPEFRQLCLKELRHARAAGLLNDALEPETLAQETGEFAFFDDPQQILDAEWRVVERMADDCRRQGYDNLAELMSLKPKDQQSLPLLVSGVRFFFRRELETNPELYRGMMWEKFDLLQAMQEQAFTGLQMQQEEAFSGLSMVLHDHHENLEGVLVLVQEKIDEIHDAVMKLLRQQQMDQRELQPRDSLIFHDEVERELVKQVIAEYREWPEEQRHGFPQLLNAIGKLEVATGAFDAAQDDFQQVAVLSADVSQQAEAHFNRYTAALEQRQWAQALTAFLQANELEPSKYTLFPFRKYEPQRILGAGGFGVAFLCLNLLEQPIVVKTLRRDTLAREPKKVFAEAQALDQLKHPAIIGLRDFDYADEDRTRPYLVMEYFEGQTLEDFVANNGPLHVGNVLQLLQPLAEALHAAHAHGIFHRDVKPGNILVRKDDDGWQVKLIDFGLALRQNVLRQTSVSAQTIMGYSIAGTIDYAAPEQLGKLKGIPVGPYTDVFGLAKTCCFALFATVQPLPKHWRMIPEALSELLEQCLSLDPTERLSDCEKLLAILDQLQAPKQPTKPAEQEIEVSDINKWSREPAPGTVVEGALEEVQRLTGHNDAVLSVAFSSRHSFLLSGSADQTVRLWEVDAGKELTVLHGHTDKVWQVSFNPSKELSPQDRWLGRVASAGKDKSVRFWDLASGRPVQTWPNRTNRSLTLSPNGLHALTGNVSDGQIRYWDIRSGKELCRLKGHLSWVLSLQFTPDGRQAVSGSADGTVRLWDVQDGREICRLLGHTDQVWCVAVSPDGTQALSASADRTVRLWDLHTGQEIRQFTVWRDQVWSVAFSPDGHLAISDGDAGAVRLWEIETGLELAAPVTHGGKVLSVAFSPDGRLAASASADKSIVVWSVRDL